MMNAMTREEYETLALERLAELARSENERIALEAARTMLAHLRLTSPQRHGDTKEECSELSVQCSGVPKTENRELKTDSAPGCLGDLVVNDDLAAAREHVLAAMDRCAGLLDHENPFVVLRAAREILQHYRHLCRERFKWTAWSEVRERSEKKRRGAAAVAKVKDLGRELAGIRQAAYREESDTEPVATQDGPSGPHEWQAQLPELRQEGGVPPICQGGQKPSFEEGAEEYRVCPPPPIDWDKNLHASPDEAQDAPPDPDERAPP